MRRGWPWLLMGGWGACLAVGVGAMLAYEKTPADVLPASASWPEASGIAADASGPTLLMFLHPHCPCSRASLGELEMLAADCPDRFALRLIFAKPAGAADDWEQSRLWRAAQALPGATVVVDEQNAEAQRFGATVSGETLVYDTGGRLLFRGGITAGRGHAGANPGRAALTAVLTTHPPRPTQTAVYGCALHTPGRHRRAPARSTP